MKIIRTEFNRSERGAKGGDSDVGRKYIEHLIDYPWGVVSKDKYDIKEAKEIMNKAHHGMKEVKDRIIECIATATLKKDIMKTRVICLVGPSGVGKTSIGKSMAESLGKKFISMSLGGVESSSEIRGHRRTYVGALPGRIVSSIISAGTTNPLFMIDEIDKCSAKTGGFGDVAASLLELFDPSQNKKFVDLYMETPIDMSQVFFVCTANNKYGIPYPLLDRMEFIEVPGYLYEEKIAIAKEYTFPRVVEEVGLKKEQISIDKDAFPFIVNGFCRDPGVRSLEKCLQKCLRKVAVEIVNGKKKSVTIFKEDVERYLGGKRYSGNQLLSFRKIGCANGISVSDVSGGSIMPIETEALPKLSELSKVTFKYTGSVGKVMEESVQLAMSIVQKRLWNYKGVDPEYFHKNLVHVHFPEGSVPKEGPSAGIATVTALMSLATGNIVKEGLAMTGEVSLTGNVLGIGGVKEKIHGVRRDHLKEVIFPFENKRHWDELSAELIEGITPHFVKHVDEVLKIALPELIEIKEGAKSQAVKNVTANQ